MAVFKNEQFPNIMLNGLRFTDGFYATESNEEIAMLKKLGVELVEEEKEKKKTNTKK